MKKNINILIIFIILLSVVSNVEALSYGGCDYSIISKLKSLITNINVSYTYEIRDNTAYFNATLNNVPENVYFTDTNSDKKYYYSDTENGEITISGYSNGAEGQYRFFIYNRVCDGIKLGTKYYKFPVYNNKYNSELCEGIENYYLCKKWGTKEYSDEYFKEKIEEYRKSDEAKEEIQEIKYEKDIASKILEFYVKYYYLFLPLIILLCSIIMVISKRKNSFKL